MRSGEMELHRLSRGPAHRGRNPLRRRSVNGLPLRRGDLLLPVSHRRGARLRNLPDNAANRRRGVWQHHLRMPVRRGHLRLRARWSLAVCNGGLSSAPGPLLVDQLCNARALHLPIPEGAAILQLRSLQCHLPRLLLPLCSTCRGQCLRRAGSLVRFWFRELHVWRFDLYLHGRGLALHGGLPAGSADLRNRVRVVAQLRLPDTDLRLRRDEVDVPMKGRGWAGTSRSKLCSWRRKALRGDESRRSGS